MSYELVESDAEGALLRCPNCGMEAKIQALPGQDRANIWKALREVRGCECPIGEGGVEPVIPAMFIYRRSDGRKVQVADIQVDRVGKDVRVTHVKVIDNRDGLSNWTEVRHFSKKPLGSGLARALQRIKDGLSF